MPADAIHIDRAGISFPDTRLPVCDVLIDGERVMSLAPGEQTRQPDGRQFIAWPPRLLEYLSGAGRFVVQEHATGVVHYDEEIRFDDSPTRVRVVDREGRPLVLNKWGGLSRSFASSDDIDEQVTMTRRLLDDLNELGYPAFAAYGTLLGAVRSGAVIGHDNDCDVSFLSRYEHPADIARESFRLQRDLVARGWNIERGRMTKLTVKSLHNVDIFTSYFTGDTYHLDMWAEGPLRRDQIEPLGTVQLNGHELPAPADPEALLALIYGPGWRIPDPTFGYDHDAPHLPRVRGWFGGHTAGVMMWNRYWRLGTRPDPSPFAVWVA